MLSSSASFSRTKQHPTLSKSINLSNTRANNTSRLSKTLKNETKNILNNSTMENIEIEYIKNLQQQVYFLELECNYLRQQLNLNGLQSSLKYDVKSQELKNEMLNIQHEKSSLEKSLREENQQKETVLNMLEYTEKTFHKERELLLKEIALLKKQKLELEESFLNKSVELTKTKEYISKHHLNSNDSLNQLAKLESQLDIIRKDNQNLRAELNESRSHLIAKDNLIKDLQNQLSSDPLSASLKKNVNFDDVEKLKNKISELTKENSKLSSSLEISLKQNEADLIMAKKNADMSKSNFDKLQQELESEKNVCASLKTQVEQFKLQERLEIKNQIVLKKRISDLEELLANYDTNKDSAQKSLQDQLKSKQRELDNERVKWSKDLNDMISKNKNLEIKINELNDSIDKQNLNHKVNFESQKTKSSYLQSQLDDALINLNNEKSNSKALQSKIDSLVRQEAIHNNLISSLKLRINELENESSKHNTIDHNLIGQLREANQKISNLEEDNRKLKLEIDLLKVRIKEIDRLKQLEDLVQSQRWSELGELAESMKNLSRTATNSTNSKI